MLARDWWPVLKPITLKTYPSDAHGFHVLLRQRACPLGLKTGQLRHLLPAIGPMQPREGSARIVRTLGVFHHLPKSLQAGVGLALKGKGCGGKIRQQPQFVAFGEDDLPWTCLLRKNFPRGSACFWHSSPPMSGIG